MSAFTRLVFVASIRICSLLARQLVRCEVAVEQCVKLEDRAVRLRRCACDTMRPRGVRGGERVARAQLMHLGETHADLIGKQATRIRKAYMEQSPILVDTSSIG